MKVIEKKSIKDLLKEVTKEWNAYVPRKNMGGDVWIERLPEKGRGLESALENIVLGDEDVLIAPKEIFFPQLEPMFKFADGKIKETIESSRKLLFGVKACDLKAILFVDDFFKRDFEDIHYLSRIKDRFIVVIGCIKPPRPQSCFCTSAKTGPFAEAGFDLQLVDNGDSYFVEVGSKMAEGFIAKYNNIFKDFSGDANKIISQIKAKATETIELKVDFQKALTLMQKHDFAPEQNYSRIAERCIYCGGCLYVCPTCTCFNLFDNASGNQGERLRNWDACVFEGYTREASGHNPREEKTLRTARRYEHKLKYDYQTTGMSGCVGCGRCLSSCPVNIGMSKFIEEVTENK